jgi:phosphatidylglycerophosphate synthase
MYQSINVKNALVANALTAIRLVLALPLAVAFARPEFLAPGLVALLLTVAIVTDYLDGPVARMTGSASPAGQLFDHITDCLFVTAGLAGAAFGGSVTPVLPVLIPIAFGQYVVDSYVWGRRKQLRASFLGRWNGVFYFVPLGFIAGARLPFFARIAPLALLVAETLGYLLVVSTALSVIDRATTSIKTR